MLTHLRPGILQRKIDNKSHFPEVQPLVLLSIAPTRHGGIQGSFHVQRGGLERGSHWWW